MTFVNKNETEFSSYKKNSRCDQGLVCTCHRSEVSIHSLYVSRTGTEFCKFVINDIVKQSGPGRKQPELVISIFRTEPQLCVFSHLCTLTEQNFFEVMRNVCLLVILSLTSVSPRTLLLDGLK